MATNKFLTLLSGVKTLATAIASSAGTGDADKIIATNSSGVLDSTFLPAGAGGASESIASSENLAAGDLVNIFDASGTPNVRKADASNGRPGHGFVLAGVTSPANATVYFSGQENSSLATLTIGDNYYLSAATPGAITTTPPATSGQLIQFVGVAANATTLVFAHTEEISIS